MIYISRYTICFWLFMKTKGHSTIKNYYECSRIYFRFGTKTENDGKRSKNTKIGETKMCLMYDEGKTNILLKRFDALPKGKTTLDFWKVYKKIGNVLSSIYGKQNIKKHGNVISNRKSKKFRVLKNMETCLHRGIHVITNLKTAQNYRCGEEVLVKVQARKCDFVAAGDCSDLTENQAVFMKVTISKEEWNRIFKKEK